MRLLWARVGIPYSPATGLPIESQTVSQMVDRVLALPEGTRIYVLAPVVRGRKGEYKKELAEFLRKGYQRVARNVDVHVLQVVLARASHAYISVVFRRHRRHGLLHLAFFIPAERRKRRTVRGGICLTCPGPVFVGHSHGP
jgi:excinuclease UvrABC ATPase subunit